jgi:hypothetical protein
MKKITLLVVIGVCLFASCISKAPAEFEKVLDSNRPDTVRFIDNGSNASMTSRRMAQFQNQYFSTYEKMLADALDVTHVHSSEYGTYVSVQYLKLMQDSMMRKMNEQTELILSLLQASPHMTLDDSIAVVEQLARDRPDLFKK